MESEKVKEIKKALEEETLVGNAHKLKFIRIDFNLIKDALTLINELESENEKLKQTNKNILKSCDEYKNRHLKQFAERLKEKQQKAFINVGGLTGSAKTVTLHDIDETLKEFINETNE